MLPNGQNGQKTEESQKKLETPKKAREHKNHKKMQGLVAPKTQVTEEVKAHAEHRKHRIHKESKEPKIDTRSDCLDVKELADSVSVSSSPQTSEKRSCSMQNLRQVSELDPTMLQDVNASAPRMLDSTMRSLSSNEVTTKAIDEISSISVARGRPLEKAAFPLPRTQSTKHVRRSSVLLRPERTRGSIGSVQEMPGMAEYFSKPDEKDAIKSIADNSDEECCELSAERKSRSGDFEGARAVVQEDSLTGIEQPASIIYPSSSDNSLGGIANRRQSKSGNLEYMRRAVMQDNSTPISTIQESNESELDAEPSSISKPISNNGFENTSKSMVSKRSALTIKLPVIAGIESAENISPHSPLARLSFNINGEVVGADLDFDHHGMLVHCDAKVGSKLIMPPFQVRDTSKSGTFVHSNSLYDITDSGLNLESAETEDLGTPAEAVFNKPMFDFMLDDHNIGENFLLYIPEIIQVLLREITGMHGDCSDDRLDYKTILSRTLCNNADFCQKFADKCSSEMSALFDAYKDMIESNGFQWFKKIMLIDTGHLYQIVDYFVARRFDYLINLDSIKSDAEIEQITRKLFNDYYYGIFSVDAEKIDQASMGQALVKIMTQVVKHTHKYMHAVDITSRNWSAEDHNQELLPGAALPVVKVTPKTSTEFIMSTWQKLCSAVEICEEEFAKVKQDRLKTESIPQKKVRENVAESPAGQQKFPSIDMSDWLRKPKFIKNFAKIKINSYRKNISIINGLSHFCLLMLLVATYAMLTQMIAIPMVLLGVGFVVVGLLNFMGAIVAGRLIHRRSKYNLRTWDSMLRLVLPSVCMGLCSAGVAAAVFFPNAMIMAVVFANPLAVIIPLALILSITLGILAHDIYSCIWGPYQGANDNLIDSLANTGTFIGLGTLCVIGVTMNPVVGLLAASIICAVSLLVHLSSKILLSLGLQKISPNKNNSLLTKATSLGDVRLPLVKRPLAIFQRDVGSKALALLGISLAKIGQHTERQDLLNHDALVFSPFPRSRSLSEHVEGNSINGSSSMVSKHSYGDFVDAEDLGTPANLSPGNSLILSSMVGSMLSEHGMFSRQCGPTTSSSDLYFPSSVEEGIDSGSRLSVNRAVTPLFSGDQNQFQL